MLAVRVGVCCVFFQNNYRYFPMQVREQNPVVLYMQERSQYKFPWSWFWSRTKDLCADLASSVSLFGLYTFSYSKTVSLIYQRSRAPWNFFYHVYGISFGIRKNTWIVLLSKKIKWISHSIYGVTKIHSLRSEFHSILTTVEWKFSTQQAESRPVHLIFTPKEVITGSDLSDKKSENSLHF